MTQSNGNDGSIDIQRELIKESLERYAKSANEFKTTFLEYADMVNDYEHNGPNGDGNNGNTGMCF